MIQKIIFSGSVALLCSGCLKIDSNLYNLGDKITEYKFDNYEKQTELQLDAGYAIADDKRTLFTLQSDDNGDKATIYALYLGDINRIATDTVIAYCHGNKWHMDWYWQRAKLLANVGRKHRFGVLMFDYRGYGLSEGTPSESGMYADLDACLGWLKAKGLSNDRLVLYGYSLGSAAATQLTATPRTLTPSKLVLEAPFASAEVMLQDAAGLSLPGSYITDLRIDNAEEIKKVAQPFLWMHGVADDFLRIDSHGQVVFNNYRGSKGTAVRVENANHSNVPSVMGLENYKQQLLRFITE